MNKRWYTCSGPSQLQFNSHPHKANVWRADPQEGIAWRTQKEAQGTIAGGMSAAWKVRAGCGGVFTLLGSLGLGFKSNPGEHLQGQVFLGMSRKHPALRHYHAAHRHEALPFLKCSFSSWISIIWNVTVFPVPTVTTMCHLGLVNHPLTDTKSKPGKSQREVLLHRTVGNTGQTWVQVCLGHWPA